MIKVSKLMRYMIIAFLLMESWFFYLIETPSFLSGYVGFWTKTLVGFFALMLYFLCVFGQKFRTGLTGYSGFTKKYAVFYLACIICVIFGTWFMYNGSRLQSVLSSGAMYFIPLLYIPILVSMKDDEDIESLVRLIQVFTFIWYIIVIVQSLVYSANGTVFLTYLIKNGVSLRNDRLRINLDPFGNVMVLYNFFAVVYRRSKKQLLQVINLGLGLFAVFYVQQSRAMIIVVMLCLGFILVTETNGTWKNLWKSLAVIVIVAIIIVNTGYVSDLMSTFTDADYAGSTIARDYARVYYSSVFLENPLLGFGLTSDESIIHGSLGTAYIDDVGISGQMAKLGIFVFLILIPLLVRMIYVAFKLIKNRVENGKLILAFVIYIIGTSYTLMILDSNRIVALPFLIAITEFEYKKYRDSLIYEELDDEELSLYEGSDGD